jgi:hypothetical protein
MGPSIRDALLRLHSAPGSMAGTSSGRRILVAIQASSCSLRPVSNVTIYFAAPLVCSIAQRIIVTIRAANRT